MRTCDLCQGNSGSICFIVSSLLASLIEQCLNAAGVNNMPGMDAFKSALGGVVGGARASLAQQVAQQQASSGKAKDSSNRGSSNANLRPIGASSNDANSCKYLLATLVAVVYWHL